MRAGRWGGSLKSDNHYSLDVDVLIFGQDSVCSILIARLIEKPKQLNTKPASCGLWLMLATCM